MAATLGEDEVIFCCGGNFERCFGGGLMQDPHQGTGAPLGPGPEATERHQLKPLRTTPHA
jgi:hypothetical protein